MLQMGCCEGGEGVGKIVVEISIRIRRVKQG